MASFLLEFLTGNCKNVKWKLTLCLCASIIQTLLKGSFDKLFSFKTFSQDLLVSWEAGLMHVLQRTQSFLLSCRTVVLHVDSRSKIERLHACFFHPNSELLCFLYNLGCFVREVITCSEQKEYFSINWGYSKLKWWWWTDGERETLNWYNKGSNNHHLTLSSNLQWSHSWSFVDVSQLCPVQILLFSFASCQFVLVSTASFFFKFPFSFFFFPSTFVWQDLLLQPNVAWYCITFLTNSLLQMEAE